jgi:pimeloyl-ACP methyl ester carboxylesterase
MTTVLFVPGAYTRMQSWWWSRMERPLEALGLGSVVVEMPSTSPGGEQATLADDVAAITAVLDARHEAAGPVLLAGHSFGGMRITAAGTHPLVSRLVYIAAPVPDGGQSMATFSGSEPPPFIDQSPSPDGTMRVIPEQFQEFFLHDSQPAAVPGALARLAPQSPNVFGGVPEAFAWQTKPSNYVVTTEDRVIPVAQQRVWAGLLGDDSSIDVPTGHFPWLAQPELLASVLAQFAAR